MYDTTERVRRVKQTALRLIQKRERTALRRLGTLCTALALGLTGALAHFIGGAPGAAVQGPTARRCWRTAQAAMCWWVWRPLRPPLS